MSSELSGQAAFVTGGASGIGRATVLALLQAGAAVAVLDRDEAGVNAVAEQGRQAGGTALTVLNLDSAPGEELLKEIGNSDDIRSAQVIEL